MTVLSRDSDIHFPNLTVITASAGAGKTYTLARRYVQFLLSNNIGGNKIQSILAITFTNLAAKEMKERIVYLLKQAALGDREIVAELTQLVSLGEKEISFRSAQLIEEILHHYSDFHVRTIDSFLTTLFKASALEFGYQPTVSISVGTKALVRQAFDTLLRDLQQESYEARFIDDLIVLIEEQDQKDAPFHWNPFPRIINEVSKLHEHLARYAATPWFEVENKQREVKKKIIELAQTVRKQLDESGLPLNTHFVNDIHKLINGDVHSVALKDEWKKFFNKFSKAQEAIYNRIENKLLTPIHQLQQLLAEYIEWYSVEYYKPFIRAIQLVDDTFHQIKRLEGSIALDDANKLLAGYLSQNVVPQVYLKLGERLNHFLIDEFQDTSPIQWHILHPLIENALSTKGSLFVVGDTKQSIYGFRGADWRIMKRLETSVDEFPSAYKNVLMLGTNYRSDQAIVDFVRDVFTVKIKEIGYDDVAQDSGLLDCAQSVPSERQGKGYVETHYIHQTDDVEATLKEQRDYILNVIHHCIERGYDYHHLAILTPNNADVVQISSWLNAAHIPFISHSTLDVRQRKVIAELIAYLRFLDSPVDNLSFATFVLGELFGNVLKQHHPSVQQHDIRELFLGIEHHTAGFYYSVFRERFPQLWEQYFEPLFTRVGYLPVYDLVSETMKTFSVFHHCRTEESALIKFLEVIKQFEQERNNSIKDFLLFTQDESGDDQWSIEVPTDARAVRVMTVHKSKGLGFPVVIAVFKDKKNKRRGPVVVESEQGLSLLKVTKEMTARSRKLEEIYTHREREMLNDDLNRLYVALTRAQREMYIVSLVAKQTKSKESDAINFPSMLFPAEPRGKKYEQAEQPAAKEIVSIEPHFLTQSAPMPVAQYEKIGLSETVRGDFVHDVLSRIEFLPEHVVDTVHQHCSLLQQKYAHLLNVDDIELRLSQFLQLPDVRPFFEAKKGRTVLCEQEVVSDGGKLYRMDRVILDDEQVTVVDFKTGSDDMNDKYIEQVKNYMRILKSLYHGKLVSGALLYIDMKKVVAVS